MAWFSENSVFKTGKHKGMRVIDVDDAEYIVWLHNSNLNIYFKKEVFERLKIPLDRLNKKPI